MVKPYESLAEVLDATIAIFENSPKLGYISAGYDDGGICSAYCHEEGSPGCAVGCHFTAQEAKRLDEIGLEIGGYTVDSLCCAEEAKTLLAAKFNGIDLGLIDKLQNVHDRLVSNVGFQIEAIDRGTLDLARKQIERESVLLFVEGLRRWREALL